MRFYNSFLYFNLFLKLHLCWTAQTWNNFLYKNSYCFFSGVRNLRDPVVFIPEADTGMQPTAIIALQILSQGMEKVLRAENSSNSMIQSAPKHVLMSTLNQDNI